MLTCKPDVLRNDFHTLHAVMMWYHKAFVNPHWEWKDEEIDATWELGILRAIRLWRMDKVRG